jgi:hypothetical protein
MIAVTFRSFDGQTYETSVPKLGALRDLQRCLCIVFGSRFPATQANLKVGGHLYDDFADIPFANCDPACSCETGAGASQAACGCGAASIDADVTFEPTSDPFFYDWADRSGPKHTLEEEVAYEDALGLGETSQSFRAWLRERRAGELALPEADPMPF